MKSVFLLMLCFGFLFSAYIRKGETVFDSDTNLTWQNNAIVGAQKLDW